MAETAMTFQDLGLSEAMRKALEKKGYGYPTSVQREAIPPLLAWKDVIAKAPTGTGKTFAFGIPMIEHVDPSSNDVQGLILAPTRELAIQICDELRSLLAFYTGIRVTVLYGGASIVTQAKALEKKPQIIVATPGRLMDHYNRKNIRFDKVQTIILDEADRMLDMGFFKDVTRIVEKVKNRKNLGLFSATISQEVMLSAGCTSGTKWKSPWNPSWTTGRTSTNIPSPPPPCPRRRPPCGSSAPRASSG